MKKKVVVVEDDESITEIIQIILEREGYLTINCRNGYGIFDGTVEIPDVYMIDRQLSGSDGLEICKYLKQRSTTSNIPVIVLSASPGIENIAKSAGADAFIEKPFSKKNLVQTVENVISNNRS